MKNVDIQLWINQYVYQHTMQNDVRRMAAELRINEKVIEKALLKENTSETALVFHYCLRYLIQQNVNLNNIFKEYFNMLR